MFTLHDNPNSPYCRKVQVLARETGQMDEIEIAYAVGHALAPEQMPTAVNPLGKIPALVRPDGPAIYDSRVICRFLDARAGGKMYPESRIWEVLTLEATADGIMDAALLMAYEGRTRPEDMQYQPWVDAQWDKIDRALHAIEAKWMGHLAGPIDAAQIAVACALGYLDLRLDARAWRKTHSALGDWYAGFAERPSMTETVPPG